MPTSHSPVFWIVSEWPTNRVRREKSLVYSGRKSRPGTGSLHPVAVEAAAAMRKLRHTKPPGDYSHCACSRLYPESLQPAWEYNGPHAWPAPLARNSVRMKSSLPWARAAWARLFALRWRSFDGSKLTISETVYRGKIRPFGKTEKSLGDILLPKGMVDELWLWKQACPDSSSDAFIFPNTDGGFMDTGNYRNRILIPLAEKLGFPLTRNMLRPSLTGKPIRS